jgi:hypothetical protein
MDAKGKRQQSDRLQVEVALAEKLFSHLRSAFRSPGASIRPAPAEAGRLLVYDFTVPMLGSEYRVAGLTGSAAVSTAGRLWVDAQSFDVARIEARAVDVPVQTGLREVTSHIDYTRVRIGAGVTRLAPQRAVLAIVDLAGAVHRNHIEFSHCREFGASSEISCGRAAPAAHRGAGGVQDAPAAAHADPHEAGDGCTARAVARGRGHRSNSDRCDPAARQRDRSGGRGGEWADSPRFWRHRRAANDHAEFHVRSSRHGRRLGTSP